jgi:hypothetical protein
MRPRLPRMSLSNKKLTCELVAAAFGLKTAQRWFEVGAYPRETRSGRPALFSLFCLWRVCAYACKGLRAPAGMSTNLPFDSCPKCGFSDLPADQAFPMACGRCELILAKYRPHRPLTTVSNAPPAGAVGSASVPAAPHRFLHALSAFVYHVPPKVDAVRFWFRAALAVALLIWGVILSRADVTTGAICESFMHAPLLVFHEAGHIFFMVFGRFIGVLGGSLFQILLPAFLSAAFLVKNRDPFGASVCAWFTGVSIMDVAPYVYDAQNPKLMLLSGATGRESFHDWVFLLDRFDWVRFSKPMGMATYALGLCLTALSLLWCAGILRLQYRNLAGDILDE